MSCSTEETNEKIESKQENDTSSKGNDIRKGIQLTKSYFWQYGKNNSEERNKLAEYYIEEGLKRSGEKSCAARRPWNNMSSF